MRGVCRLCQTTERRFTSQRLSGKSALAAFPASRFFLTEFLDAELHKMRAEQARNTPCLAQRMLFRWLAIIAWRNNAISRP
jgi:hypothetical protein